MTMETILKVLKTGFAELVIHYLSTHKEEVMDALIGFLRQLLDLAEADHPDVKQRLANVFSEVQPPGEAV